MKTIETKVFGFDELDATAKERAREWMREGANQFFCEDALLSYDDFQTCAHILGITFSTHAVRLMGGTSRTEPDIYWSGFSSQGDGASFAGWYRYAKGASQAIRKHAPLDKELHRIADALSAVQRHSFYSIVASVQAGRGSYSHSHTMEINVESERKELADGEIAEVRDCLRDFANWMYRQLETEYEYRMSDEAIDEDIRANEYTFTESGERFG